MLLKQNSKDVEINEVTESPETLFVLVLRLLAGGKGDASSYTSLPAVDFFLFGINLYKQMSVVWFLVSDSE